MSHRLPLIDRRQLLVGATAVASTALLAPHALADEAMPNLSFATVAPPGTPWAKHTSRLKKRVKEATEGRVKMKVYLGGALGDEKEAARKVSKGELSGWLGSATGLADIIPELAALELPYLFSGSAPETDELIDRRLRGPIDALLAPKGLKLIGVSAGVDRWVGTRFGPVRRALDVRGRKMRTHPHAVHTSTWRALNAQPAPMADGVGAAIAERVVEGAEGGPHTLLEGLAGCTHLTRTRHSYRPQLLVVHRATWRRLPREVRSIFEARDVQTRPDVERLEGDLNQRAQRQGVEVYTPTRTERTAMATATRGLHREFTDRYGSTLYKAITKHI